MGSFIFRCKKDRQRRESWLKPWRAMRRQSSTGSSNVWKRLRIIRFCSELRFGVGAACGACGFRDQVNELTRLDQLFANDVDVFDSMQRRMIGSEKEVPTLRVILRLYLSWRQKKRELPVAINGSFATELAEGKNSVEPNQYFDELSV